MNRSKYHQWRVDLSRRREARATARAKRRHNKIEQIKNDSRLTDAEKFTLIGRITGKV